MAENQVSFTGQVEDFRKMSDDEVYEAMMSD
jgi:hypothetical protein